MPIRPKSSRPRFTEAFGATAVAADFSDVFGDRASDLEITINDELESLRQGTRHQYESDWVEIKDPVSGTLSHTFTHNLGEIPWVVDVIEADDINGLRAQELRSGSQITIAKDETTITLTRDTSATTGDLFFKVRAM